MPAVEPDLNSVFRALADNLQASDIIDVLDRLVEASTDFTTASEGGIVLADGDGVLHVMASTSERTADVEEAQLGTSEGPCLDCVRTGEPVEIPDLAAKISEWPKFSRIAEDRGFRAVHATPMRLRNQTLGSLCLFSTQAGPLSDRDAALVQTLADAATLSLVQQQAITDSRTLSDQLQHALESRIIIEQAKGAVAQRLGISIDDAFKLLRRQARTSQQRLRDVAAQALHTSTI